MGTAPNNISCLLVPALFIGVLKFYSPPPTPLFSSVYVFILECPALKIKSLNAFVQFYSKARNTGSRCKAHVEAS